MLLGLVSIGMESNLRKLIRFAEAIRVTKNSVLIIFVVLACHNLVLASHKLVLDGFDQHFQATVHFLLSSAIDKPWQHQVFFH